MQFLKEEVAGWIAATLGALLLVASLFGGVQTWRLDKALDQIETFELTIDLFEDRVADDARKIDQRDTSIKKQNKSIADLKAQADKDRTDYLRRIADAQKVSQTYRTRAEAILARQTDAQTELERSRAALQLIKEELSKDVHP